MSLKKKNTKSPKSSPSPAIDEKKKHAIETYQEYEEDVLTSEEQNSKTPMILAFIAALSLIILSVLVFSLVTPPSSRSAHDGAPATATPSCDISENSPVCAHNGKTYKNACLAEEARVTISHIGACLDPETPALSGAVSSGALEGTGGVPIDVSSGSSALLSEDGDDMIVTQTGAA